jgi:tetratricopeptide (TPR) repeat protein
LVAYDSDVSQTGAQEDPAEFLAGLGSALWERFQTTRIADDLDDAIEAYLQALACAADTHPARSQFLGQLAWLLTARFHLTSNKADLQAATDAFREAIAAAPDEATEADHLVYLASSWWTIYIDHGRDPTALDQAIDIFGRALAAMPAAAPLRVPVLVTLTMCLRHRKGPGDLDRAIETYVEALELPSEPALRARLLDEFGSGLVERYRSTGDRGDLEGGVARCREAVQLTPGEAAYRSNLGAALYERYHAGGLEGDLQEAIEALTASFAASPSAPAAPNLSQALFDRYERHGRRDDLEQAIKVAKDAIASLDPQLPDLATIQLALGTSLTARHVLTGDSADADEATAAFRKAADLAPADPHTQNNLSVALLDLYQRTGEPRYLHDSIDAARRAAADAAATGGPLRRHALGTLASALLARFNLLGELDDLDTAITLREEAVRLVPVESPHRPGCLSGLANAYATRYRLRGPVEALVSARAAYSEALDLTPRDSPDFPLYMNNWAGIIADQYGLTDDIKDLDAAAEAYALAASVTQRGSPFRPVRLSNLGVVLWQRYGRTRDRGDLEQAIAAHEEAIELTPPSWPERPMFLSGLGDALWARYAETGDGRDLERGVQALRQSSEGVEIAPSSALGAANTWARWAAGREAWDETVEAYRLGIEAVRLMLKRQLSRGHKEVWLGKARELTALATVALARSGDLEQAALAAENGRAFLLSEALERERAEREAMLASAPRELVARYRQAVSRLGALERTERDQAAVLEWAVSG